MHEENAVTKTTRDKPDIAHQEQGVTDPASATVAGEEAQPTNRTREQAAGPAVRTLASGAYGIKRRQDSGNSDKS
jgi:hypothetical protein